MKIRAWQWRNGQLLHSPCIVPVDVYAPINVAISASAISSDIIFPRTAPRGTPTDTMRAYLANFGSFLIASFDIWATTPGASSSLAVSAVVPDAVAAPTREGSRKKRE